MTSVTFRVQFGPHDSVQLQEQLVLLEEQLPLEPPRGTLQVVPQPALADCAFNVVEIAIEANSIKTVPSKVTNTLRRMLSPPVGSLRSYRLLDENV